MGGRGAIYVTALQGLFKVSPAGQVVRRWSLKELGGYPIQPVVDAAGNVYTTGRGVIRISPAGGITPIIPSGTAPDAVHHAAGLALVGNHLFVAEEGPNVIKEFSLSGQLVAIWMP